MGLLDGNQDTPDVTPDVVPDVTTDATTQGVVDATTSQETTSNWRDGVPEEYREAGWVTRHDSQEDFYKSMMNAQSMIGKKLGIPTEDDEVSMAEYRERLGVPDAKDGYEFKLPEGFTADEDSMNSFKELAHKANVSSDMANEIYNKGIEEVQKSIQAYEASKTAEVDEAFKKFGELPNFKEVSVNVTNLLNKIDPSGEVFSPNDLSDMGVNAPKVAMLLNKIAEMTGDDKVIGTSGQSISTGSREEQINAVMRDYASKRISLELADSRREQINKSYGL